MRMVRWMCNVKVKDRVPSKELRERLGIDDISYITLILQQNVHETKIHDIDDLRKRLMQTCFDFDRGVVNAGVTT